MFSHFDTIHKCNCQTNTPCYLSICWPKLYHHFTTDNNSIYATNKLIFAKSDYVIKWFNDILAQQLDQIWEPTPQIQQKCWVVGKSRTQTEKVTERTKRSLVAHIQHDPAAVHTAATNITVLSASNTTARDGNTVLTVNIADTVQWWATSHTV